MIPPPISTCSAGIPVADYAVALSWYKQLLGKAPSFLPNDTEAVWSWPPIGTSTLCCGQRTLPRYALELRR